MWLQNTSHSWLLILDNADNKDLDLARFLPAGKNGSILITSRLPECENHSTVGNDVYERLNQGTAINLLLKACGIERSAGSADDDDARAVAELLGCHALAIMQAGAAVHQGICGLREYKKIFRSQRQILLHLFPTQEKSTYGGVYATFEVSAAYLKKRNDQIAKNALQLLNFYAFIHFTDFPEVAFEEAWKNSGDEYVVSSCSLPDGGEDIQKLGLWHVSHLPKFMQQNLHDIELSKICFRQARSLLVSLSLVAFDSHRGTTRMHPVSHLWSKDRLQKPEESMNARLNGLSVLSLSIKSPYTRHIDPWMRQLQPHIESITHSLKEWNPHKRNFHFQQSVFRFSWMYHRMFNPALLEMVQMIPIQANESWIKTENGQRIQILHGISMRDFGDANKAVTLLKSVVEIRTKTLRPKHPHLLTSQYELAKAYLQIDETAKAIPLLKSVVEIRTKTLRPEHRDLLTSQHVLATAYLQIDETAEAIALLESVVEITTNTLRPEHPDLLASQHELARAYLRTGETDEAIALLKTVVDIRTETLRPEHQDLLTSQHVLAIAYLRTGETDEAMALLKTVVEIRTETLRADHPDRVGSIYTLAQCHYRAGNYKRALHLAQSIEDVAQNPSRVKIADWNADLIGYILEEIDLERANS